MTAEVRQLHRVPPALAPRASAPRPVLTPSAQDVLIAISQDWLFASLSEDGKRKLLAEHLDAVPA